jgi:hypothetical protein
MTTATELLAEVELEEIGIVVANDAARSSFTVVSGNSLLALDGNLDLLGQWPLDSLPRGWHSTLPAQGLALISSPEAVLLMDQTGRVIWSYAHTPWSGSLESGCTWFDVAGEPHAVIPAPSYDGCLVLRLDLRSGNLVAQTRIEAEPAGIQPVHHPDGWVGLSDGEGQDAVRAWWVRSTGRAVGSRPRIDVLDAGWDDWVLSDVDGSGTMIITTPHNAGPLLVRSFPNLEPLRTIDPPDDEHGWDFTACFAGDVLVDRVIGPDERLVAVGPNDAIYDLEGAGDWLIPAAGDSWLSVERTLLRRWRLA